jgi:hypothetical protein
MSTQKGRLAWLERERYGPPVKQHVRLCTATDGVRLAYAVHGSGPRSSGSQPG